jgi:hypothetical protein
MPSAHRLIRTLLPNHKHYLSNKPMPKSATNKRVDSAICFKNGSNSLDGFDDTEMALKTSSGVDSKYKN